MDVQLTGVLLLVYSRILTLDNPPMSLLLHKRYAFLPPWKYQWRYNHRNDDLVSELAKILKRY